MSRQQTEAALHDARAALGRARRALPKAPHGDPDAAVAWFVEQAQRNVRHALDAYYPVAPESEGE